MIPLTIPLDPRRALPAAVALLFLSTASISQAATPVLIWGFQHNGCERMPEVDRAVEKELYGQRRDVGLLQAPNGKPLPACSGERCAQAVKESCSQVSGRLLGGQVVKGRNVVKTRLWLYDLSTGQTAYQDDYCESCEMLSALTSHARRLIDSASFGPAPSPMPSYCATSAMASARADGGPIFLTVYGDGKNKTLLHEALKQQLGLRGRQVLPIPFESKTYGIDELQRIVSGQQGAQVLGANVHRDGKVQVFLFDQRTERTDFKTVNCPDCTHDKDAVVARVQPEVAAMLDHCFEQQCADPRARPGQPPAEACEAFSEQTCSDSNTLLGAATPSAQTGIDPGTARLIKGLTWGAFAGTAATGIALFAANASGAGRRIDEAGNPVKDIYSYPAWTATGIAVGLLAITIPVTIMLDRKVAKPTGGASAATSQPHVNNLVQCPN